MAATIIAQASTKNLILTLQNLFVFGNNIPVLLTGSGTDAILTIDDIDQGTQEISADGEAIISSIQAVLATGTITAGPNTPMSGYLIQIANWQYTTGLAALGTLTVGLNLGADTWTFNNFQILTAPTGSSLNKQRVQDKVWKWSAQIPNLPSLTDAISIVSSIQSVVSQL